jgi:putative transposase
VQIVKKPSDQVGTAVYLRRCVVERTIAWLGSNIRLARDSKAVIASTNTFLYAASVILLTRRFARSA